MSQLTPVAVGIVFDTAKNILIAYRSASQYLPACWEFPGGKIESEETVFQALSRELKEEVGITVILANPMMQVEYAYVNKTVNLNVWTVDEYTGTPSGCGGQLIRWASIHELAELPLLPGNERILTELVSMM